MRRLAALVGFSLLLGASTAGAAEATVMMSVESWYAVLPSVPPRPAGTLHVGVAAGLEESRTYLALDLSEIPPDGQLVSGVLRLPVDAADSTAPDTATIDVCLAGDPGPAVEGSTEPPPPFDCSVRSPATFKDGAFTADLAPFIPQLRTSGLAIVPVADGVASWHVAFFARTNSADDASPITALLELNDEPAASPSPPDLAPPSDTVDIDSPVFSEPGADFASPAQIPLPPAPLAEDDVTTAPTQLGPISPLPTPVAAARYGDSLVFTLPLLLVAIVGYFGAALTRPITLPVKAGQNAFGAPPERRRAPLRARAAHERPASG